MSAPLTEKARQTRGRMIRCAQEIILEDGIEALSMDRVAERAGMSKGAVMYHFKTKRALLAALIEAYAEHLDERLKHAESFFEGTPDETLVPGYILWFREFDKNNMGWADIGLSLLVQKVRDPELLQPVRDWYARLHERVAQMPPERRIRTLLVLMTMEGFFFTRKFGLDLMTQDEKNEVCEELLTLSCSAAKPRAG